MNIHLSQLVITTKRSVEVLSFSDTVTFLYGPVGTGKSTVARLVDYCLGGELERTPAIQQEFVSAELKLLLGESRCGIERAATDTQGVRISWLGPGDERGSVGIPLDAGTVPVVGDDVFCLSDLLFKLCGVTPIKVRQRQRDPDSPMVRLSFRDVWRFCYLDQAHLDSSFFRLEDTFRGRKSQDALRFFTGLHSERLSDLEGQYFKTLDQQQGAREAVKQIRAFMARFDLGSELDVTAQIEQAKKELAEAEARRAQLEAERQERIHPTDGLRARLRQLSAEQESWVVAIADTEAAIAEQRSLHAELVTTKTKSLRAEQAGRVLSGVAYVRCPSCGTDVARREPTEGACPLCTSAIEPVAPSLEAEALRRELNERLDQLSDSIKRREQALTQSRRRLIALRAEKANRDLELQRELARYDSAFVESVRAADRDIARLLERQSSLERLQEMPRAVDHLEQQAGELQGQIDRLRHSAEEERARLRAADEFIAEIAAQFKAIMLRIGFPGVHAADVVELDPRNWRPEVRHDQQGWSFWDAGSGGKKTLFNVCFALGLHEVARKRNLPVPRVLMIDSPTKNISDEMNPDLVKALYREVYRLATDRAAGGTQFLVVDSDLVEPEIEMPGFITRRLAAEPDAPSLIPYYEGP